jgi:hypothetical protein
MLERNNPLDGDLKMPKHFFVMIVVLLLTATICTAGCASNNPSPTPSTIPTPTRNPTFVPKNTFGYLNYTNRSAGVAIQYPPSWQPTQGGETNATAFFNVTGVEMSFSIATESLSGQTVTLDDYSHDLIGAFQQNGSVVNFAYNLSNVTLAGYPAQKIAFTFVSADGTTTQGIVELTLANGTGYALTYVASQDVYSTYLQAAQNMMQSFNIIR